MNKYELRKFARQQRKALSDVERNALSEAIAYHYMECFRVERPKVVHVFLPIENLLEVNTLFILEGLNKNYPDVKTVTSIIAADGKSLVTVEVRFDSPLVNNAWGIPEPVQRILCNEYEIEEVLTPLLAVDERGFRVGYGKGFYDRFFKSCTPDVKKTGLNFFKPVIELVEQDAWDIPLTRLISPENIIEFI